MARKSQLLIPRIVLGRMIISATGYALAHPDLHNTIVKIQSLISRYAAVIPHVWINVLVEGMTKRHSRHKRTITALEKQWSIILRDLRSLKKKFTSSNDPGKYSNIRLQDFRYLLFTMFQYSLGARTSIVGETCRCLREFVKHLTSHDRRKMKKIVNAHLDLQGQFDPYADSWLSILKFLESSDHC